RDLSALMREMRGGAPEVMKGFSGMAQAALQTKALDTKTKELIALAIGVATRCDDCIAFHAKAAVDQGASQDEIFETLGMAIYMGAGPSVMYAAHALDAYNKFAELKQANEAAKPPA
ncbi:MAG: carboxymuconolactone decarboxylase family protein, partial [Hyphomicrobiaceae bacterium]